MFCRHLYTMLSLLFFLTCISHLIWSIEVSKITINPENKSADPQVLNKIAAAHFAKHYHYWNFSSISETKKRRIRSHDGISFTKAVKGIVGVSLENAFNHISNYYETRMHESCMWFGTAPLCEGECGDGYDYIRSHNGRYCDGNIMACPDRTFGEPCTGNNKKVYCCSQNPVDCQWNGLWINANNAEKYYCTYHASRGKCGHLKCYPPRNTAIAGISVIHGEHCDTVTIFGRPGIATCGFIAFYTDDNFKDVVELWYKDS